jgi:hypothetical protein
LPSAVTRSAELTDPFATVTTTGVSGRTSRLPSAGAIETWLDGEAALDAVATGALADA